MKLNLKNKQPILCFLIFLFICPLFVNYERNQQSNIDSNTKTLRKSGFWDLTGTPISIDDTNSSKSWAFAKANYNWLSGSGTWGDPYIIENITMDGGSTGNGIEILNSNVYFIIRNCSVYNIDFSAIGILLENVNNGILSRNNVSSGLGTGIYLDDSRNNTISENIVDDNYEKGIKLFQSFDNEISRNNLSFNSLGIEIYESDDNILMENIINYNNQSGSGRGINFYDSHYNIISKNTANNNEYGFAFHNSNYNTISNNTANNNGDRGLMVTGSNYNSISENKINNSKMGVEIMGAYNVFINNKVSFCDTGFRFYTSSHNIITNNKIFNNSLGILLESYLNNSFYKNFFIDNDIHAIDNSSGTKWNNTILGNYWDNYSGSDADNNGIGDTPHPLPGTANSIDFLPIYGDPFLIPNNIHIDDTGINAPKWSWAATRVWGSGSGTPDDPYVIENLKIDAKNNGDGILIGNSSVHFIIRYNTILNFSNQPHAGIKLDKTINGKIIKNNISTTWAGNGIYIHLSNNTIISDNNVGIAGNSIRGVYLLNSKMNTILGNLMTNTGYGISLENSDLNIITRNVAISSGNGLYLYSSSDNYVSDNSLSDSQNYGVHIEYGNKNVFLNNDIKGNDYGIYLFDTADNEFMGNSINNNHYGVYFYIQIHADETNNNFINNDIADNDYGLYLEGKNDVISGNNITNSYYWGLKLNANDTLIYLNNFSNNPVHAIDIGGNNAWNSINIGNFWDNYTGVDLDDDGIGDTPYIINLSPLIQDLYPIWEDGDDAAPTIVINEPEEGDLVGRTAPIFNVLIKDRNLDRMWYTIDGGFNNVTFAANGSINQLLWETLWDSLPNSSIILIRFYANDTLNHLNSEYITVIKFEVGSGVEESIKGYNLIYLLFSIGLISIFLIKKRKRFI